jgi:hypothetical protein
LIIYTNNILIEEKTYILHVIFKEFLGISYELIIDEMVAGFCISLNNGTELNICSDYFNSYFIDKQFLPVEVIYLSNDYIVECDIPVLFGKGKIEVSPMKISIDVDLFGTCFFILSRVEETITDVRDNHGRFPATASLAFKYNFLERPIVDEYVEMLWNMLLSLDPELIRKKREFKKFITCDVDWPFDPLRYSLMKTMMSSAADIIRRKNIFLAVSKWKNYLLTKLGFQQKDTNRDNVSWIMDVNEKAGNKVAFYFITHHTSNLDSQFDLGSEKMRTLFLEINARGHEIGIHPGYNCYNNYNSYFEVSVKNFIKLQNDLGLNNKSFGGRMHYLRWDNLITPQLFEKYGISYDSSLAFADKSGFRCGTVHPFPMFNLVERKCLSLIQRPLVSMECTIISPRYEGLLYTPESLKKFELLKEITRKFEGEYTLLWHNTHFNTAQDKKIYQKLIS